MWSLARGCAEPVAIPPEVESMGKRKSALTKRVIDRLHYAPDKRTANGKPATQQIVWDDDVRGLGVRLQPGGSKSFVLKYRTRAGRNRIMALGRYGPLTLDTARDRARKELGRVADGVDPAEERDEHRKAVTLRQFADIYIERHSKPHNRTWKADRRRLDINILPKLGGR